MPTKFGNSFKSLFLSVIYALIYSGAQLAFSMIFAAIGLARGGPEAAVSYVYGNLFITAALAMAAASVLYIALGLLRERPLREDLRFPSPKGIAIPLLLLAAACRLGVCVYSELAQNISIISDSIDSIPDISAAYSTPAKLILAMTVLTLLGPIFEEIIFRGFIQTELLRTFKPWAAIFLSSLIFSIFHGILFQSVFTFFVGLALGWCRYRSGGLTASIILHIAFNASAAAERIPMGSVHIQLITAATAIILGAAAIIWIKAKTK